MISEEIKGSEESSLNKVQLAYSDRQEKKGVGKKTVWSLKVHLDGSSWKNQLNTDALLVLICFISCLFFTGLSSSCTDMESSRNYNATGFKVTSSSLVKMKRSHFIFNESLLPHEPTVGEKLRLKEKISRYDWLLYSIEELIRSSDGKVRSVILESELGKEFLRPITKVCPLEVDPEKVFQQN